MGITGVTSDYSQIQPKLYAAAAVVGTALSLSYIKPSTTLGSLSTVVSGVAASQLFMKGMEYSGACLSSLYARVYPERFADPIVVKRAYNADKQIEIAFIEIERGDRKELIPVQRHCTLNELSSTPIYTKFTGTYEDALLMIAQDPHSQFPWFRSVLEHPSNRSGLTIESFISFLCTPNQNGIIPIHLFNIDSRYLEEVVNLIQSRKIVVNLSSTDFTTDKTLLQKCLSEVNGYNVAKKLLLINPEGGARHLEEIIQYGEAEFVSSTLSYIKSHGIDLSFQEKWLIRAFQGDCSFSDEEYAALPQDLQEKIFKVANIYNRFDLVIKLRSFHPCEIPVACRGPGIVSVSMDAVQIRNRLIAFFQQKRQEGLLYTEKEFRPNASQYYAKKTDIGRVLGRDFIEKIAKEQGITCVKAPRKTIVLPDTDPLEIGVFRRSLLQDFRIEVPYSVVIWPELITPVNKHVTRDQMRDLLTVIEITGFDDLIDPNNIMYGKNPAGEEAFYIIDTEFDNFRQAPMFYSQIQGSLSHFMSETDQEWFAEQATLLYERLANRDSGKDIKGRAKEEEAFFVKYGCSKRFSAFYLEYKELTGSR